jgi:hypothetical protein
MFAANAVSLWRLNQSAPGINYLARSRTVEKAHSPSPYSPSMAQASVRGACGFVLVVYTEMTNTRVRAGPRKFRVAGYSLMNREKQRVRKWFHG